MDLGTLSQQLNLKEKDLRQKIAEAGIKVSPRARKIDNYLARQIMDALQPKPKREAAPREKRTISLPSYIKVKDYVELLKLPISDVIKALLKNGIMANINEEIDYETAAIIAQDLGFEIGEHQAEAVGEIGQASLAEMLSSEQEETLKHRPPIVAVMGHVDHGKTSLLDYIRKTNIAGGEAGAITQHIGAYQVKKNGKFITFLDTPGHEAFSEMRSRGANVTDMIVLVVAADDSVQPQTVEVINRAKFTNTPLIVAINKIDKEEANIAKIKQELSDYGVLTEDWGGKTIAVPISARTGSGIDELLEMILLTAEVENYRANPEGDMLGTVIEAHLSKGQGPIASVIVQNGTLKVGDIVAMGPAYGRVRQLEDALGKKMKEAVPSTPTQISGLSDVPQTGDILRSFKTIDEAKTVAYNVQRKERIRRISHQKISADPNSKNLILILKADVQGSIEAIKQSFDKLKNDEVKIAVVSEGVGEISETDINQAAGSKAIVIGFNTKANPKALNLAKQQGVQVDTYDIIYELIEDVTTAVVEMLSPELIRTSFGNAKILKIFMTDKKEMVIGGRVEQGMLKKNSKIKINRNGVEVGTAEIIELQQQKIQSKEVAAGNEFGMKIKSATKIEEGDVIESYEEKLTAKQLSAVVK